MYKRRPFEQRVPFQLEHRLRRRDGEYRWVVTAGVPRYKADRWFILVTLARASTSPSGGWPKESSSQKLIEAREGSRRIARELHDDINQRLAVVSMRLGYLKEGPPASAAESEQEIGEVGQEIAGLAADIQAVSHRLHPAKLEILGLEGAAAGFCEELSTRHGVRIDVALRERPDSAVTGNLTVSLPRLAGSPAKCRQA